MSGAANNFTEVIKVLNDFIEPEADYRGMPIEEVRKLLKDEGFDPTQIIRSIKMLVNRKVSAEKIQEARKLRERLLGMIASVEQKHSQIVESLNGKRQDILDQIKSAANSAFGNGPVVHFRNLEQVSDADLLALLDDLKRLDQLNDDDGSRT